GGAPTRAAAAAAAGGLPSGRGAAVLPGLPVGAELVVAAAGLRVFQDGVGLADLLEALLGAGLFIDVGVVLTGEFAVGALDLVLGSVPLDAEHLVVVLIFHGHRRCALRGSAVMLGVQAACHARRVRAVGL